MTRYNEMPDFHMAIATGDDAGGGSGLTAWRNGDQPYIAGELQACDIPLGWNYTPISYDTITDGSASTNRVSDRYSVNRKFGTWKSMHAFQTCQFIYWLMQTAAGETAGSDPYTHTLTIGGTSTPRWHGIQFEREGIASSERRYAFMGLCPSDLVISCSERQGETSAIQEITIPYASKVAGGDIAAQTQRPAGIIGTRIKTWYDCIAGNGGGLSPSGLKYNGTKLGVDIVGHRLYFHRNVDLSVPDTNGLMTIGQLYNWKYWVELDIIPTTGSSVLYALNGLKKESYAGDLDYLFSYEVDASNDDIDFAYDKMYMPEFDEINDYSQWKEAYTIMLEPLDTTSSLTVVGIDDIPATGFGNA